MTGAGGFIGSHVSSELIRRGYAVRALTRSGASLQPGVEVRVLPDLDDVPSLRSAFKGATAVVHLAGHAHVMSSGSHGENLYRQVNVVGTRGVAEAAASASVGQLIFASSVKAIGEGGSAPFDDETPPHPEDAYGKSKLEAEKALFEIGLHRDLPIAVLRFPLVYGPGVKGNLLRLLDAVWRGFPLPVGGIQNERSMLGIDNLVAFLGQIVEGRIAKPTPLLVSDEESISTEALVRMMGGALGRQVRIINMPSSVVRVLGKLGDAAGRVGIQVFSTAAADRLTGSLRVDSARAWRLVGMRPPVPLEEGIRRVGDWYKATHMSPAD